ncbi:dipeptidyl aminopeptidase-like protein 6 isoform X2 [Contarinia nasturtii]|uniref:dipeptidyl aminopeptidase-like protein 6 isoform X2 n=1 Tax=Contarinia nasturtii TaxID=265458 RepID=UPI0012D3BD68|nr:dipeptidyl aminopeptidase-like protein 6 isoform X2 [Contarinia nasturtii]
MADGGSTTVTVSVISGAQNPLPESEMDALLLGRTKELVASSPSQRNWRGIFIALLVIAAVLGLIVFSIVLLSPEDEGSRVKGRRLTLGDINENTLKWKAFNGSWISDYELVYRDPTGGLSILSTNNLSTRILMTNATFRQLNAERFLVSPDLNFVVLIADIDDDGAKHYIYEVNTRNKFPLTPKVAERNVPKLQHATWAPKVESSTSNPSQAIAFVYDNDLYYKPKVESDLVCRITHTGKTGTIYNGVADWFYSHIPDLISDTVAFSTDGAYLSYLSFNDTAVNEYKYSYLRDDLKYPEIKSIRYPKAQTKNPNVTVHIVDLTVLKFINQITIISPLAGDDNYVGQMVWISATDISITFTNRNQTSTSTVLCRAPTFRCREVFNESIVDNGFVLPNDKTIFSRTEAYFRHSNFVENKTKNTFESELDAYEFKYLSELGPTHGMLKRLPVRDGENGYFRHLVFISTTDMRTIPLTMGRYEVTEIVGWDEKNEIGNQIVYFMATPPNKPGQRHLYNISLKLNVTQNMNRIYLVASQPMCLTCKTNNLKLQPIKNVQPVGETAQSFTPNDLFSSDGEKNMTSLLDMLPDIMEDDDDDGNRIPNNCLFNKIYFSKNFSHYVQECLGPDTPSTYLVETATNTKVALLNGGDALRKRIREVAAPQVRTFSVEIRHGFLAQVRLFLPPGMKEDEEIAFPLILHVDSSPGSQLVSEEFKVDWNWYVSSQRGMIVAQIDARGTACQGELLRSAIKNNLGSVEIEDQLGVLKYLRDNLKFIDPTRICAYGWGYGGYAATMILAEDSQRILQCAFAVNPIVSFAYHNSYFTERYMPSGFEYQRAIQDSDLSTKVGNIDSRNFLLIHGTADTLVHEQHSLILTNSLTKEFIGFRHQIYTNEGHYMKGALLHLYKTVDWFLDESFGPSDLSEWEPTGFFAFKQ